MAETIKDLITAAAGPNAVVSVKGITKHGPGNIVRYTVRFPSEEKGQPDRIPMEYRVGLITSRGLYGGDLLIR